MPNFGLSKKHAMILSDKRIMEEMEKGTIKITPFNKACLGSNSYDVHLGKCLATYKNQRKILYRPPGY